MKKLFSIGGAALLVAVIALGFSIFRVIPTAHVDGETYIGTLVSILGLLITFAVGYQIYNAVEMRETLKEVGQLKGVKQELDTFEFQIRAELQNHDGVNMRIGREYLLSTYHYMRGLNYALRCDYEKMANRLMDNAVATMDAWDGNPPEHAFACCENIEGRHPKNVVQETMDDIVQNFGKSDLFKEVAARFYDVKQRIEDKIRQEDEALASAARAASMADSAEASAAASAESAESANEAAATAAEAAMTAVAATQAAMTATVATPAKRGRKPAAEAAPPKKRGRRPAAEVAKPAVPPKKRGRKPAAKR
jgi:hypothetical protein